MDMIFEKNRLASFKKWPFSDKFRCNPKTLAEAGFYFVSSGCAKCFVCFKELEGWESDDDPWSEHRRHAKNLNCEFVNTGKKESEMTVKEFLRICSAHEQKFTVRFFC
uniref:Uncharacterized protein n=1 Tax=Romanomermis culicivorax TaxID=13658 RepID=A0A915IDP6_ROMCU